MDPFMLSNDVQIARVAKIGADVARRHGKQQQQQRDIKGISKGGGGVLDDDIEFVFGSISPRGGGPTASLGQHRHVVGSHELDSPEHTQRDTTESDNNISSCSTLDIVNKVEQLSVQQLENRVRELSQRLQQAERQLAESNVERDMCHKRLEVVSQAHECRITEMHCVIAELSKKLRSKQEHIIMEEQEPEGEGSELSYQEGSIYNSELNLTNADAEGECQTEPLEDFEGACSSADNMHIKPQDAINKGQLEALQEEVLHLRAQIALLQAEMSTKDKDSAVVEDQPNVIYFACELEANENGNNCGPNDQRLNDLNACVSVTSPQKCVKMAERVKLRCASKNEAKVEAPPENDSQTVISNEEINLVEHLVCKQNSLMDSFMAPLQVELERLQRKMEQLKMRNTLLSLTLDESKEHTEHLYLLCGKYESNAVALQLALNCSDRAIEAYDVMLALLESRLALLSDKSAAAEESRRAVETVAHHLLARLESEKNLCENSLGPWQHNINLGVDNTPKGTRKWCDDDDNRLRYHVSKLKGRRSVVQHTIVNLESPFSDVFEKKRLALEKDQELREHEHEHDKEKKSPMDLETAVIMQELLDLREQNHQLKTEKEEAEREQQYANERVSILHEALKQLQSDNRVSYSEAEHAALTEQQLVEALSRETELKSRIQTLLNINATQKANDEKCEQMHQNLRQLQKSNDQLSQLLEQSKRKYQLRMKRLEQKVAEMRLEQEQQHRHRLQHNELVPETTL
ncbi:colorectal mutant cancer protein isoform X1 [Drosophila novamexicana]|uniref:colorectal mutant cancer protein isoform X1 n=1 Tax=Drosophila novamexicana TaxID=47314 RepID=UPI0011E5D455|nr:colorectal mutant cancer protein isoform X1 [Drosophila novamexicana]